MEFIDYSTHITVRADMGQGRKVPVTVVSGVDIGEALCSCGLMPAQDFATALQHMGDRHANTFIGELISKMLVLFKYQRLHEVNRYKLMTEDEKKLARVGVRFNKTLGEGSGNKDYRPMYPVEIVPLLFVARVIQMMEENEKTSLWNKNYVRRSTELQTLLTSVKSGYTWQGQGYTVGNVVVYPYATEKEEAKRDKDSAQRTRVGKKSLILGRHSNG